MKCYACNCRLSPDRDTCPKCGADIRLYRKIIYASNQYYNLGLARAKARDLTGAAECLRTSLQLYKKNIQLRTFCFISLFHLNQFNSEIQFFACHFVVGVKGDILFIFCDYFHREWLAILVGQVYLLTFSKVF